MEVSARARAAIASALVIATACGGSAPGSSVPSRPTEATTAPAIPAPAWRSTSAPTGAPDGGEWIVVDSRDGRPLVAVVYRPVGAGPAPVAIALHADGGLRERFLSLPRWLAEQGFLAVAPCWTSSNWAAAGASPVVACAADAPLRNSVTATAEDIRAIVEAARTLPGARADRLALVGHSLGAMAALFASMETTVDATVSISAVYGRLSTPQFGGTTLLERAERLRSPVLMVHGTDDAAAPFADAKTFAADARARSKEVETLFVEGAPHQLPFTPQYWTDDVKGKVIGFLRRRLP
ncbi:MAG TPA: dienelactone hydrolase family protein [Candidatus Limnocylindria bacterium]